ncbi:uncharacterized protein CCOS01_05062, partial [Colletotrichum costaricense]
ALSCHGYGNFIIAPCSQRLQKPIEHQVSSQSSYPQIELRTQSCTSGSAVMVCPPVPCPRQQRPMEDSSEGRDVDRRPHLVDPGLVDGAFKGLAYTYPCNNGFWYQKTAQENDAEALTGRTRSRRKQCVLQEFTYIEGTATAAPLPDFCQRSSLRQSDRVAGSKFSDCWYADTLHVHLHFTGPIARRCAWLVLTPALAVLPQRRSICKKRVGISQLVAMPPVLIWRTTVPVDSTSMYGARISEARQMFEGTLTTLLNPKRVISKCTITRRA